MSETLTQVIYASTTPGVAATAGAALDTWEISGGGLVNHNGVNDSTTAGAICLYYHGHVIYHCATTATSSGAPGWWSWSGTTWTAVACPVTEVGEGFAASYVGPIVFASQTAGTAAAAGATLDTYSISTAGQVVHNGVADTTTSQVIQLYYHLHRVYYESALGNSSGTPGWWDWNGTGWSVTTNPVITTPQVSVGAIANQTTGVAFTVTGSLLNYGVAPTLSYMDNSSGNWILFPSGSTITNVAFAFTHPAETTATTTASVAVWDANHVTGVSNTFSITAPGQITLNSIALAPLTFSPGVSPITVGTVTVGTTPTNDFPGSTGTLAVSGTDAAFFTPQGTSLVTTQTTTARTYNIGITATLPGAVGSPLGPTSFAIVGQSTGPGPTAAGSLATIDYTGGGGSVSQFVWGVSFGQCGNNFSFYTGSTMIALLKSLAYPLMRINSSNNAGNQNTGFAEFLFPGGATTATQGALESMFGAFIDSLAQFAPPNCRLILGMGQPPWGNWSSAANFAAMGDVIMAYWLTRNAASTGKPFPVYAWEVGNENNDQGNYGQTMDPNYFPYYNAFAAKARARGQRIFGPVSSYFTDLANFHSNCGGNIDAIDAHGYAYGPAQNPSNQQTFIQAFNGTSSARAGTDISGAYSQWTNAGGSTSTPIFMGEWNQDNTYGATAAGSGPNAGPFNAWMDSNLGAVFGANWLTAGINASPNFQMAGVWSLYLDTDYGMIGAQDVPGGGSMTVSSLGKTLSLCGQYVYGTRAKESLIHANPSNGVIVLLGCSNGPAAGKCSVMLSNNDLSNNVSGTVGLSHWPVNGTGTGTINMFQTDAGHQPGNITQINVTAGVTSSITLTPGSVTILYTS